MDKTDSASFGNIQIPLKRPQTRTCDSNRLIPIEGVFRWTKPPRRVLATLETQRSPPRSARVIRRACLRLRAFSDGQKRLGVFWQLQNPTQTPSNPHV